MPEWFENEAFWVEMYSYLFPDERFSVAEEQVEKALALVNFQQGKVLDLCCGPGRHSVALAKRGIPVTAVDRTEYLLSMAKKNATDLNLEIEFVLEDMRNFVRPGAFTLVLNMFTSFGYFDNKDDDLQVLRNAYESLAPGGAILIDLLGKEILAKKFQPITASREAAGSWLIQQHEIFDDWTRIRNEWILVKGEKAKSFKFHHTLYSGQELKCLLERAGFAEIQLFGDLDGNAYGLNASRLIAVGKR